MRLKSITGPIVSSLLLVASNAQTITNLWTSPAFSDSAAAAGSIASVANGAGTLDVRHIGTTNLTLNHAIDGYIAISNGFKTVTIGGGMTPTQHFGFTVNATTNTFIYSYENSAAFSAYNGTNLTVTGGTYSGEQAAFIGYPPIPGQTNRPLALQAGTGGYVTNVAKGTFIGTSFYGGTDTNLQGSVAFTAHEAELTFSGLTTIQGGVSGSDTNNATGHLHFRGASGMELYNSALYLALTTNSHIRGGNSGAVAGATNSATAQGGAAIYSSDSELAIQNGTVTGGFGAPTATSGNQTSARSLGGAAVLIDQGTSLRITGGTYIGGSSFDATATGTGASALSQAGNAIHASGNSTLTLNAGTFLGGSAGKAIATHGTAMARAGSAIYLENGATATIQGGTFTGGDVMQPLAEALPGYAVLATNATINISGGTFIGGKASDGKNVSALYLTDSQGANSVNGGLFHSDDPTTASATLKNSRLTIWNGGFGGAGLLATASAGETNRLTLNGGSFSAIRLVSDDSAVQYLNTDNTPITITNGITQRGGWVYADGPTNSTAFQQVTIDHGTMEFQNSFLLTDGRFSLISTNASARFKSLIIEQGGTLAIQYGGFSTDTDLTMRAGGELYYTLTQGKTGTNSLVHGQATFEQGSKITVDVSNAGFLPGDNQVLLLTAVSNLFVGTELASSLNFTNYVLVTSANTNNSPGDPERARNRVNGVSILNDNLLYASVITKTLTNWWGISSETPLGMLATELDLIANTNMLAQYDSMVAQTAQQLTEQTYLSIPNSFQVILQGHQAAVGQSIARGSDFREMLTMAKVKITPTNPKGPSGPEKKAYIGPIRGEEMHGWAQYYGQFYSHDREGDQTGYDATLHGGVFGIDKAFGNLLIGLSGGAGTYTSDLDSGAETSTRAYHGSIYSTIGTRHTYLDAGVAYGNYSTDTRTAAPFILDGSFDATVISGYLGGGFGFEMEQHNLILTPEASLHYALYDQEAYRETGTSAEPREFAAFDADSLKTMVGLNFCTAKALTYSTFTMKPELRLHWIREHNPEPDSIHFNLVNGTNQYSLDYPQLDEDSYRIGIGFIFRNPGTTARNIMARLDFDEFFGQNFNSHNLSAKVIWSF
jgi:uncharacterized protein YhjY with autotransporter beta-barrel domain